MKEALREALKEMFESREIDIFVKEVWSEWSGKSHEVTVVIDNKIVYREEC